MERTCIKCGHTNASATGDELEACPACGAIYSRAMQAHAMATARRTRRVAPVDESSGRSLWGWLGLIAEILAWVFALYGASRGVLQLSEGLAAAESAPQQAAAAAIALATAAIPYCFARAIQQLRRIEF